MSNRRLTSEELAQANELLSNIRSRLDDLSRGDAELRFALNRKVAKELGYDERSKPMVRRRLKEQKQKVQDGKCAICNEPLGPTHNVLDRKRAADGYTAANTRLICQPCDIQAQAAKGYA